jgi:hypothetical protein
LSLYVLLHARTTGLHLCFVRRIYRVILTEDVIIKGVKFVLKKLLHAHLRCGAETWTWSKAHVNRQRGRVMEFWRNTEGKPKEREQETESVGES